MTLSGPRRFLPDQDPSQPISAGEISDLDLNPLASVLRTINLEEAEEGEQSGYSIEVSPSIGNLVNAVLDQSAVNKAPTS